MKYSNNCVTLVKSFESFSRIPYLDVGNIPTIGYGATTYGNGVRVTMKDCPITEDYANQILLQFLNDISLWLNKAISYNLNQNQFDACISFFYNVGWNGFADKNPNTWQALQDQDLIKFSKNMLLFDHVDGKICNGLTARRQKEYALFNK